MFKRRPARFYDFFVFWILPIHYSSFDPEIFSTFRNSEEENFVKEIIDLFDVRFINQEIAEIVIKYRKQYRIKLPDAIIAATAEADGCCLVTRNIGDFKNIDIRMLNPFD